MTQCFYGNLSARVIYKVREDEGRGKRAYASLIHEKANGQRVILSEGSVTFASEITTIGAINLSANNIQLDEGEKIFVEVDKDNLM